MAFAGFISRQEWGARPPRSWSNQITPKGVAVHWGGPPQRIVHHEECFRTVRGWQAYHMDVHSWSDLAYSAVVGPHGYVFAGRGAGVRTAANGTDVGNQNYYAVCGIIGQDETPTGDMLDGYGWAVRHLRQAGAGGEVVPHSWFKPTACPGDPLRGSILEIDRRASQTTSTAPSEGDWFDMATQKDLEAAVGKQLEWWLTGRSTGGGLSVVDRLQLVNRQAAGILTALESDTLADRLAAALNELGVGDVDEVELARELIRQLSQG